MTNLETVPPELVCDGRPARAPDGVAEVAAGPGPAQVLSARDVPLGGLRAMTVRRTLPQRGRSFIGAWCFCDHYGPDDVTVTGGMSVAPHPHTGLQTVSWLFSGEIEHRDSLGTHAMVRPGELNLMTAGYGISHSEVSTPATTVLHGVQLWTALPEPDRDTAPAFEHHVPPVVHLPDAELRVFLGSLGGSTSPVRTYSPLVGAEILLSAGALLRLDVDPAFEHGVLVDAGAVSVDGRQGAPGELVYLPTGRGQVTLQAGGVVGGPGVRLLLIGGLPLGQQIVMWWNFIGRSHDEVVAARSQWQAEIGAGPAGAAVTRSRFGIVPGLDPLPAPGLPGIRLIPRE
ncbi:pirin family protein [Cellulomonas sp. KRMCY2]|uniref:pirin family protein n=1 Tax=Cellulomonas sp. KRMCY2 TaxID=1304865 RepID=UPI00045E80D6|nr:pirin family protein [Cellulomonas sp. KRMCY2]